MVPEIPVIFAEKLQYHFFSS